MKIEEFVKVQVSLNKKRDKDFWNLDRRPELKAAIEKCLATGEEQFLEVRGSMLVYSIRPDYPLIESAMAEEKNKSLLKVNVCVLTHALHMGVRA